MEKNITPSKKFYSSNLNFGAEMMLEKSDLGKIGERKCDLSSRVRNIRVTRVRNIEKTHLMLRKTKFVQDLE